MLKMHVFVVVIVVLTAMTLTTQGLSESLSSSLKSKSDLTLKEAVEALINSGKELGQSESENVYVNKWDTTLRVRRKTNDKVKLHNNETPASNRRSKKTTRVVRGYKANNLKKKGYGYKKPGYVYKKPTTTTTTTRQPPLRETMVDNDSDFVTPSPPDPEGISPDRGYVTEPPTTPSPFDKHDIRDNVPGEPGKDYKVYSSIPQTNFSCEGKIPGFYADPETGCQVFHRCTDDPWYTGTYRSTMDSFLCPNGTLYNQQIYTCDWWGNVHCESAPEFYQLNEQLGQLEETNAGTVQYVQFGGVRVPPPPGQKRNSPKIVPKNQRQPLPDEYRTKTNYDEFGVPLPQNGDKGTSGQGLSTNNEDPENLANKFLEDDGRGFSEFSAGGGVQNDHDDKDKEGSSIEVVTTKPSRKIKRKSGKKVSKKSKSKKTTTTTTTTTTPAPEDDEDEEDEDDENNETRENEDENEDDDTEEEEEPSATNTKENPAGFIVNRDPVAPPGTPPKEVLVPPNFTGDPVDSDKERSEEKDDESTENGSYIPPTGPTYIPPTTTEKTKFEGYSYPKPDANKYLPPQNTYLPPSPNPTYLPPPTGGYSNGPPPSHYLPPQQNNAYLPPQNNAYLPPQNNAYLPPPQNNSYGPPNNLYLPPNQNNASYLPPQQQQSNTAYGPPTPQNTYLPPTTPSYPPGYLPPSPNNSYLPPNHEQQKHSSYPPSNTYLPPTTPQPTEQPRPIYYFILSPDSSLKSQLRHLNYNLPRSTNNHNHNRVQADLHHLQQYFSDTRPTISSSGNIQYSNAPILRPPPREKTINYNNYGENKYGSSSSNSNSGGSSSSGFELFQVPLVTSSHSHTPIYKR